MPEWSVDTKHWQQKISAKLKLRNQIAEPDSRRSCLNLVCLGGVDALKADAVLGVGAIENGDAVAVGHLDDLGGEGVGRGCERKTY